jgi:ABC-type branched-subunit amino acid transport system ATPase component
MLRWPTVVRAEREAVREAHAILEVLGIDQVAHERADELPYGIQKRVDVARMLAGRPRLVLLDEPAAGLAHDEADRLIDRILEVTRPAGATVVLIEHNIDLVTRVADRMCVMTTGSLLTSGRPAEVVADPRVVEAYLGG